MKLALFRNTTFDYPGVWDRQPYGTDWVQVSDWLDVEFPPLSTAQQEIAAQLLSLAKRQKAFEEDFRRQRTELDDQRKALLKTGT